MLLATDSRTTVLAELNVGAANRLVYTPYGFQSAQRPVDATLGFNGQRRETPTGWYHLGNGHRVYNPILRRFHAPDTLSPFGKGGLNAYAYCEGDPVNFIDPTGQFISEIITAIRTFEVFSGNAQSLAYALFGHYPQGVLGYAAVSSNLGYTGLATGMVMQVAGFPSGLVVSNVGAALVSAGNAVRAAHGTVQTLANTRLGRAVASAFSGTAETPLRRGSGSVSTNNFLTTTPRPNYGTFPHPPAASTIRSS